MQQNGVAGNTYTPESYELTDLADAELDIQARNCYRLIVLGSAGVGKSAIIQRFLFDRFANHYFPTIEDFHRKIYKIKGETYRLDILDTSGNHPFQAMRRILMLSGDLFLLVYAIDNLDSYREVQRLRDTILEIKASKSGKGALVPIVIAGNKSDQDEEREVLIEEALTWVSSLKCTALVETSASTGDNIAALFTSLFETAKLPGEMSPYQHKSMAPKTNEDHSLLHSLMRRDSEAKGAIAPHARRPSLRTDLLEIKNKSSIEKQRAKELGDSRTDKLKQKCTIL